MKRNNVQKGHYSKSKGQREELAISKILSSYAKKDYGPTSTFMRTYSSGSMSGRTLAPGDYLISDVYPTGKVSHYWEFNIEAKNYSSTSLRRYYEGTKRLQSWLLEVFRDTMKETRPTIPLLITHINRFRDMVLAPYQKAFFQDMNRKGYPCWSTYESFVVPETRHVYRFHMLLTDLQSIIQCMSCKQFIKDYKHCDWNRLNKKYAKYQTKSYLKNHSRKEMSTNLDKIVNHTLKHK